MARVVPGARTGVPAPVVNADTGLDTAPTLLRRMSAEFFGTFLLVLGVIGTALFTSQNTGILGVAMAVGLSITAGAYAVGHISGGHFNPAVSIGAAAAGRFAWADVMPYIAAQVFGGAFATTILFAISSGGPEGFLTDITTSGFASNGFGDQSPAGFSLVSVILAEVVLTAILLYVVLGTTDRRAPSGFAPLAIGVTVALLHLIAIPISNASFNPARSIATAIYGGPDPMLQLWVFLLAPIVGALIAGLTYVALFDRRTT